MKNLSLGTIFVVILLCLSGSNLLAQPQARNWLFGDKVKVDFNQSSPQTSTVTTTNAISTLEGSSSISDANGQLLFYTDGTKIWDKNNNLMPNGSGLSGNSSTTQSALIVPCTCNKYYVFTPGNMEHEYVEGLRYSVVDMSLNGGFGDIVSGQKDQSLITGKVSEKLAGISDGTGGFWVVAHTIGDNRFHSFRVTGANNCIISVAPEVSSVGTQYVAIGTFPNDNRSFGVGTMKISPDGTKIAVTGFSYVDSGSGNGYSFVELFNFDRTTGRVTNIPTNFSPTLRDEDLSVSNSHKGYQFYGLEFSPNSKNLYVTTSRAMSRLIQYDATTTTPANFVASRNFIHSVSGVSMGQLQRAPNGLIYIAKYNLAYLSVINIPDDPTANATAASVGFQDNSLALNGVAKSLMGLPTVVSGAVPCIPDPGGVPDPGFDGDGVNTFPAGQGEGQEIGGAALQFIGARKDRIVVASKMDGATSTRFLVRSFDANSGSMVASQTATVGTSVSAWAATVNSATDDIYVAGSADANGSNCAIAKFGPNLAGTPSLLKLALPATLSGCQVSDIEISGNFLYVLATTQNSAYQRGVSIIRIKLSNFTFDSAWQDSSGIPGFSRTVLTPTVAGTGSLVFDANRVYASVALSGSSAGTAVLAYDKTTSPGNVVTTGFGNKTITWVAGSGVFFIPVFGGTDMVMQGTSMIISGKSSATSNDFGLRKLSSPYTSAGNLTAPADVDLGQTDLSLKLALDASGNVLAGGFSTAGSSREVGLIRYAASLSGVTSTWTPANLQSLALSGSTINFGTSPGDRRRIRLGAAPNLLFFQTVLIQSTGKIVIVSKRPSSNFVNFDLVFTRLLP